MSVFSVQLYRHLYIFNVTNLMPQADQQNISPSKGESMDCCFQFTLYYSNSWINITLAILR